MTRDEAKKMAEELAELDNSIDTSEERAFELGFMACYDAMTKGPPDGWCAWHPIMGFDAPTFETERRLIANRGIESCVDKGASWAVKPVKLIKVEG